MSSKRDLNSFGLQESSRMASILLRGFYMIRHFYKSVVPTSWRKKLWSLRASLANGRRQLAMDRKVLGEKPACLLHYSICSPRRLASIQLADFKHRLYFRPRSSDTSVIRQVFTQNEYESVGNLSRIEWIIDCGANIGCTSFFFLHRYPEASVIVVEPDPGNMALCRLNLRPFAERVTYVQAGLWPEAVALKVIKGRYRDRKAWSYQVRPSCAGEAADIRSVTMSDLIQMCGGRVELLKIDIEAAEREVFGVSDLTWLDSVRNIAIELHDNDCVHYFERAMRDYDCRWARHGELTVCTDIMRRARRYREVSTLF